MIFQSRIQAGEKLAQELLSLNLSNPFVLAIPRGGAPVARSVADTLHCPLDVIPLMKIPIPWSEDASYGTMVADGTIAMNMSLVHRLELSEREIEMAAGKIMGEAQRREQLYRKGRSFPSLENRSVVIIDDAIGSGYSMLAAVDFVKKKKPRMIIAASPVSSDAAFRMLAAKPQANLFIALVRDQDPVFSLDSYYKEFSPVTDDDVLFCLRAST
jgi:predicted phosphoribosyltransferase